MALLVFAKMPDSFGQEARIALVIGNSKYEEIGELRNTTNDARDIHRSLEELGYRSTLLIDATETKLRRAVRQFSAESENASAAIVFYAGHGAQIAGQNYLLPVDLEIPKRESDVQLSSLKLDDLINSIKSKVKIVFLDACRDNPALVKSLSSGRGGFRGGLAPPQDKPLEDGATGIFVAYATDAGNVALDGQQSKNSPFTSALKNNIRKNISIDDMFALVTREVRAATRNQQRPYKYASLDGIFCLASVCQSDIPTNISELSKIQRGPEELKIPTENWAVFNFGGKPTSEVWFVDTESLKRHEDRVWGRIKVFQTLEDTKFGRARGSWTVTENVVDCTNQKSASYGFQAYDSVGNKTTDIRTGSPRTIAIENDARDVRTFAYSVAQLFCSREAQAKLLDKRPDKKIEWERFFSLGEIGELYIQRTALSRDFPIMHVLTAMIPPKPINLAKYKFWEYYEGIDGLATVAYTATVLELNCSSKSFRTILEQSFTESGEVASFASYMDHYRKSDTIAAGSFLDQMLVFFCKI